MLDIKGTLVTIDAMACQNKIAKVITDKGGDYLLAVKINQGKHRKAETLHNVYFYVRGSIERWF